jgi:hypothetical protein
VPPDPATAFMALILLLSSSMVDLNTIFFDILIASGEVKKNNISMSRQTKLAYRALDNSFLYTRVVVMSAQWVA